VEDKVGQKGQAVDNPRLEAKNLRGIYKFNLQM